MKSFKTLLHILITTASLIGFLGGWASLAHALKPASKNAQPAVIESLAPLPAIPPMPAMGASASKASVSGGNLQIFVPPQSSGRVRSFFRTSGS